LLLHRWSLLEFALVNEIKKFRLKGGDSATSTLRIRGSTSERLGEWRALISQKTRRDPELAAAVASLSTLIERLRRDRDAITQHFEKVGNAPGELEARIFFTGPLSGHAASAIRSINLAELNALIGDVDGCRDELEKLGQKARQ
jgi:hypothetical protein